MMLRVKLAFEIVHSRGNSPTQLSTFASTPSPAAKPVLETRATRATCEKRENCAKLWSATYWCYS